MWLITHITAQNNIQTMLIETDPVEYTLIHKVCLIYAKEILPDQMKWVEEFLKNNDTNRLP